MSTTTAAPGTVLMTGSTGYVGSNLLPELLDRGWRVRVLTRSAARLPKEWADRVDVVEGDATDRESVARALDGVDVAYYLLHSMDGEGDFIERDREMAQLFSDKAAAAGVGRIVYLGGLHPDGELSPHLRSRVEVGEIFLASPTPSVVLQAGIVLGDGSASFQMLRHLTERLPAMITPKWALNTIQPIGIVDVVYFLASAAGLEGDVNRSFDLGGPDVLTYAEMMKRYAEVAGLVPRVIVTVPVLTPSLASHWIGLVTPVKAGIARPLIGSLVHDAVCREQDLLELVGPPPGGRTGYTDALKAAMEGYDPLRWRRSLQAAGLATAATAVVGSLATDPGSRWYRRLDTPGWQPPAIAFPVVWTALYTGIALSSAATLAETEDDPQAAKGYAATLAANLALNAGWSALFFKGHRPGLAAIDSAALAATAAELTRRARPHGRLRTAVLGTYTGWCTFATALTVAIWRRNRR